MVKRVHFVDGNTFEELDPDYAERYPDELKGVPAYVLAADYDALWRAFSHIADSQYSMTGEELWNMLRNARVLIEGGDESLGLDLPDSYPPAAPGG
jgi:hypothetical protein